MEKNDYNIIRIALIGPESTSKSTLSKELAKHYKTVWVKEYAREYLKTINRKYVLDDILQIAQEQFRLEQKLLSRAYQYIFVDTELIISKVWCEDVFKTCPDWINENIIKNKYDLYLLTYPDLPWEADPLRENPNRREFFFNWYEKELKTINANYAIIKGVGEERLKNSIEVIEKFETEVIKSTFL
jgi:NadR type nicotinamide-nucleotide adenylyltransferase